MGIRNLELKCAESCPFHNDCNVHYFREDSPCVENINSIVKPFAESLDLNPVLDIERPKRKYSKPIVYPTAYKGELRLVATLENGGANWKEPYEIVIGGIDHGSVTFSSYGDEIYERIKDKAELVTSQS